MRQVRCVAHRRIHPRGGGVGSCLLASAGFYMREIANLASSRWLKPYPKWIFFREETHLGCVL
jgi:hypothetical protein